jgi:heavy metal-binding protein
MYLCPMHADVQQPSPGKCPRCGMNLVPEGARFGLIRHMASPLHLTIMAGVMIVIMAAAMMMMR